MNVGYNELNTADVATMLGVQKCTVVYWCQHGHIKYQDVSSPGSKSARYLFDVEEINRVQKLREKYGKAWVDHNNEGFEAPKIEPKQATIYGITDPEDYIPDADETIADIKKLRALKVQRDKLAAELEAVESAIKTMQEKIIADVTN